MRKIDIIDLLFLALGVLITIIAFRFAYAFPSYEHTLNLTNPLNLSNYSFVLCKLPEGEHFNYVAYWNLTNKEFELKNLCGRNWGKHKEDLAFEYGYEGFDYDVLEDIDELFSGQRKEIKTPEGIYYLSKLEEKRIKTRQFHYETIVIIEVQDRTQGKKFIWEK